MAKLQAMVPAELAQETSALRPGDELLTADELQTISLFDTLKKAPSFNKFPGTTVLRRGTPGRVICAQGQPGSTAYYILTSEDALKVKRQQLQAVRQRLEHSPDSDAETPAHQFLGQFSPQELAQRERELQAEIETLVARVEQAQNAAADDAASAAPARRVASARLLVQLESPRKKGLLNRLVGAFQRGVASDSAALPKSVPIDGPTDIDTNTMQAPMLEGDIFGEMSCMNRAPRSATVTIEEDCYLLEMLRNVLDMLQRDASFRKRMDDCYRQRVMETNVRRMALFQDLSDEEYAQLQDSIELDVFDAGAVIVEEHEPSDALYVVRSGLIKVVRNTACRLREDDMTDAHWQALPGELTAAAETSLAGQKVWEQLPAPLRTRLEGADGAGKPDAQWKQTLLDDLNRFMRDARLHLDKAFGKTRDSILDAIGDAELRLRLETFPEKAENWSELESRIFHRLLLEHVCPRGLPRRMAISEPMQTLSYLGRGEIMGEMGVLRGLPRSATCVAYDHPDSFHQRIPDSRTGAVPSRVELVRIPAEPLRRLLESSPRLRYRVEDIIRTRERDSERRHKSTHSGTGETRTQTTEFEEMGLIQGQQLMLIDLDRCTRCDACVEACVAAHDDGHTRLYLDGPRFEKYLVPISCRSCLDPVCMIGCPVGAINRGENGEIRIRDWCIGCKLCSDQCPYGSIQMNEVKNVELSRDQKLLLDPTAVIKPVTERAVVCDLCSSLPSQDPSCVYACPHDAAIRVDARDFFFDTEPG